MMEKEITAVERFYRDVSDLLGIDSTYEYDPLTVGGRYRTRWNNRKPGNGRFEGHGIVRYFGPDCVHAALNGPVNIQGVYDSREFLTLLRERVDEKPLRL